MSAFTKEFALAKTVGLPGVCAYLSASGWVRDAPRRRETCDIYRWPQNEREFAIVPNSEHYSDYGLRIFQLAEQVARFEGRRTWSVLTDMSIGDSDIVRIRLPGADPDGAVKLTDGGAALGAAQDLLLAAADSVEGPGWTFAAGRRAAEYLRSVRLGRVESGCLVIRLCSPVPDGSGGEAFERKVTRRLVSGLRAARRALDEIDQGAANIGAFENAVSEGVSADLCRSLARLAAVGNGLEVAVSWAVTGRGGFASGRSATVDFAPLDVPVLGEAARVLTAACRPQRQRADVAGDGRTP